jgi:hypothetical protein
MTAFVDTTKITIGIVDCAADEINFIHVEFFNSFFFPKVQLVSNVLLAINIQNSLFI